MKKIIFILIVVMSLSLLFSTCKKEETPPTISDITYENNIVSVPPDAKIIYNGEVFNGTAQIPLNKIIGIIKDSIAYLYYTSMGNANLSDETSEKAIGLIFSHIINKKTKTESIDLSTGITITNSSNPYNFKNKLLRFAAIENGNSVNYLPPTGGITDMLISSLSGHITLIQDDNINLSVNNTIGTYGSSLRLASSPLYWPMLIQKNNDAINNGANIQILTNVNIVDIVYLWQTFFTDILGAIPICMGEFTNILFTSGSQIIANFITKDDPTVKAQMQTFLDNSFNSFISCAGQYVIIDYWLELKILTKFLNIVKGFVWICDDISSIFKINDHSTYETWAPTSNWELFKKTINNYFETDNLEQAVVNEFGSNYRIADWNDVVSYCQNNSPTQFINNLNMQLNENLIVVWNGQHFWNNGTRHFFISRFDHNKPGNYLSHDNIDNHHIDLGSWYGLNMPILCVKK